MRKISYSFIALVMLVTSICISCNNKNDPPSPPEHSGLIMQKWNVVRIVDTTYYFNGFTINKDDKPVNDYLDFRTDGKLYRFQGGVYDTATFTITNEVISVTQKYLPTVMNFKIVVSTTDSLQLYGKGYVINNSHDEKTTLYYLNR